MSGPSQVSLDHSKSETPIDDAQPRDDATAILLNTHGFGRADHSSISISIPSMHPKTRQEFLKLFAQWMTTTPKAQEKPPILWLAGPSGIGKTTVQLHLARHWGEEGRVIASCFFPDHTAAPETVNRFVVTLAHQIALNVPGLWGFVSRAIRNEPDIFSRRPEDQMVALVFGPLEELVRSSKKSKLWKRCKSFFGAQATSTGIQQRQASNNIREDWQHRNVVIVDGLDEVMGREAQERIVGIMEWATMQKPLALRFVVTSSKSENDVVRKALASLGQDTCRLVTFGGYPIDNDILVFLNDEFARIGKESRGGGFPEGWPGAGTAEKLVVKARGLFVYASTLIRLMDTPRRDPVLVLQQVLDASLQENNVPRYEQSYAELDALYSIILHPPDSDLDLIRRLLQTIMFSNGSFTSTFELEERLSLQHGSVDGILSDLHSIVSVPPEGQTIRFRHRTIRDYLASRERSGDMYLES